MELLTKTINSIVRLDDRIKEQMQEKQDSLAKPVGSLGRLEELSITIAAAQQTMTPSCKNKWITIFSADHGIATQGVTNAPQIVTALQTMNFIGEGAGINAITKIEGIEISVTDVGIACDYDPTGIRQCKIKRGTDNMVVGPAMSREQAIKALEVGIQTVAEIDELDILGTGEMGLGNTSASTAILATFLDLDVDAITGIGSGITDEMRINKSRLISKAIEVNAPDASDPIDVLSKVGGLEIGAIAGAMLAAAARHVPVIVDGFISSAAAQIAITLCPEIKDYMILSHQSAEKGHNLISERMGMRPLFDLGLRLGEGTGAALAINLCETAVQVVNQMVTLQSLA